MMHPGEPLFPRMLAAALSLWVSAVQPVRAQIHPFTSYTTADGLAQSAVSAVHQDSRGFLWFGTWGGISRYDGNEFWSLRNSTLHVTALCDGPGETIWIGTTTGLARLSLPDSTLFWIRSGGGVLPSDYIPSLLRDRFGNIWAGTDKGLAVLRNDGTHRIFDREDGLQDLACATLREDSTGAVLIASAGGILRCRLQDDGALEPEVLLEGSIVGAMTVLRNGDILASLVGDRAVLRYHGGVWTTIFTSDMLGEGTHVRSLGEDAQGNIWIGTTLGLAIVEAGQPHRVTRSRELSNQYVGAIYRDREEMLWLGTESGAVRLRSSMFRSYSHTSGLPGSHVIAMYRDMDRGVWLGTYNGCARITPEGHISSFGPAEGLPHPTVHAFTEAAQGSLWIGTWEGLVRYDRGSVRGRPVHSLARERVIRMLRDRDGSIWCGGDGKILKCASDGTVLLTLDGKSGVPDAGICALFQDAGGRLWFGTDACGAGYLKDGAVIPVGVGEGMPDPWVMSIGQDHYGTIWFGTQKGAVSWDGTRAVPIRTDEEELRTGIVTFVVRDSAGTLWFGTQRGIFAWNDSVTHHLEAADGLIADATRSGMVDPDGDLWVGTVGGVSRLDMRGFQRAQAPPPVSIRGLALDGGSPDVRTDFVYDENTLTIHFVSLSFRNERRAEFQWALAGIDAGWQPPRRQRSARYPHLPWGKYEFLVRARNGRGAWSDPARIAFVIRPPFWGTWWFRILSVTAVAGLLLLVYRRRVRGLEHSRRAEREFSRQLLESQERERKRLAGELHDGLVQTLLVAKNHSLLGIRNAANTPRVAAELEEVSAALSDAIEEVRTLAHALRPYQLDRLGLPAALRALAETLTRSSGIIFTVRVDDVVHLLTPDANAMIYRMVQEASVNALKHSGATAATITVTRTPRAVEVSVQDNGSGFPAGQRRQVPGAGFGLNSIHQRAAMLGGTVSIAAPHGGGAVVSIRIPVNPEDVPS